MYSKRLPNNQDIVRLGTLIRSYPTSRAHIVRVARMWNFKPEVISLLRQFPADQQFDSRTDFVGRVQDLALLIRQEWESPKEFLLSS